MGNQPVQSNKPKQKYSLDNYQTEKERKVLQWRSNPTINQFIPKAFLQYQDKQCQDSFLNDCKINQNLPIGVRFENYIGNLTLLKGKLRFQESLYVLKSLLTGYQVILSYFRKVVVNPNFCFVTKQGEVKAWINSDYRKNTFETLKEKDDVSVTEVQKLFLKPQQWIDQNKQTSSISNIINSILIMVQDLTYDKKQYKSFIKKVNLFVLENILKNYDFDRISKFINKFIYQKKLFVKSNLIEAIQRIYKEHQNQNQISGIQSNSHVYQRVIHNSPQNEFIKENIESQLQSIDGVKLRKCVSGRQTSGRSFTYNGPHFVKKSTFFQSTLNLNGKTKFSTMVNSNADNNFKDYVSSSKCSSRQGTYSQFQTKPSQRKNFISPQYSYNHFTNTNNTPQVSKKIITVLSTPKSSCISSKNSFMNKNNHCQSNEGSLKIITQRKQIQNEEQQRQQNRTFQGSHSNHSIKNCNKQIKNSNVKNSTQVRFSHLVEEKKDSFGNIKQNKDVDFNFTPKNQPKLFNSNHFQSNQDFNNRKTSFVSPNKNSQFYKNSIMEKSSGQFKNFTMKTITKLISSNGQISDQQISQGDFPSNQNISSYSGILASMGRSAQLVQVPSLKGIGFKNDKKIKTMMFTSSNPPNNNPFMSKNMFETH